MAAALILAAATGTAVSPAPPAGAVSVSADVSATILRPVIVRQVSSQSAGGLQAQGAQTPSHQITRNGNTVQVEFQ